MKKYTITKGCGNSKYAICAFDNALLASGIADYNLIKLSSILPAGCSRVDTVDLPKGSFLHTAFSKYIENRPGITISAAIAIAIPKDKTMPGVIMESSGSYNEKVAVELVASMVEIAMEARGITEFEIIKESITMKTKDGFNCAIAAVSIW